MYEMYEFCLQIAKNICTQIIDNRSQNITHSHLRSLFLSLNQTIVLLQNDKGISKYYLPLLNPG